MNMTTTKEETEIIRKIAKRATALFNAFGSRYTTINALMNISAAHCNACPLKLAELLAADDFNFSHDIAGIRLNLNRATGKIENCFLPRFSK